MRIFPPRLSRWTQRRGGCVRELRSARPSAFSHAYAPEHLGLFRAEMSYLREHYDVDRLGICGSCVRGEPTDDSNLDLLVTVTETPGLLNVVGLKQHLEGGLCVDLGMPIVRKEGPAADNIRREAESQ